VERVAAQRVVRGWAWAAGRGLRRVRLDPLQVISAGLILVLAGLMLPPLAMLIQSSLYTSNIRGEFEAFTWQYYHQLLFNGGLLGPLGNTLVFALGSCGLALALGAGLAWVVERTNAPLRRLGYFVAFSSFAIPYILYTIAWLLLLGKGGPINAFLMSLLQTDQPPVNVYSLWGMVLVEGLLWSPLAFLMLAAVLRSMDPALEEAALMSGAGLWRTTTQISFRLALPGLLAVVLLVFIRAVEAFDIPALVGLPSGIQVLTTQVYLDTKARPPEYGRASALAVLLLLAVGGCLYGYQRLTREAHRFQTITGKGYRPRVVDLGRWRYLVSALLVCYGALVLALPLALLLWASIMPFYTQPALESVSLATLRNYATVLTYPGFLEAMRNTLLLGIGSATLVMGLMAFAAWLLVRGQGAAC
jgi:iron(III) transport system permease protein